MTAAWLGWIARKGRQECGRKDRQDQQADEGQFFGLVGVMQRHVGRNVPAASTSSSAIAASTHKPLKVEPGLSVLVFIPFKSDSHDRSLLDIIMISYLYRRRRVVKPVSIAGDRLEKALAICVELFGPDPGQPAQSPSDAGRAAAISRNVES